MAEEKKKNKSKKSLLTSILTPIIIVVLIAGIFFAITDGIVNIIKNTIVTIVNFLRDPIGMIQQGVAGVGNAVSKFMRWNDDIRSK